MEDFGAVNWLAVGAGTVVAFVVGWLWYSPLLFGKKWAEGSGVELGSADKMPAAAMVSQFVALLCLAMVIGLTATSDSLITAIFAILAVGFMVFSNGGFSQKSTYAMVVDLGHAIVAGVVMIAAQGLL
ncbi:MAG: DUF1761 family protein [Rhodobacteraceae bacterium]|nr:DUF1761 family protein [Paracoccaceae bacterium]